jgi:hypothetical protein
MRARPLALPIHWIVPVLPVALLLACGEPPEAPEPLAGASAARDNAPPHVESVSLDPASPRPGGSVRALVEVTDPDGDPVKVTYEWKLRGEPVGGGMPKLVLSDAARGDHLEVAVVASDGRGDSAAATASAHLGNRPPEIARLRVGPSFEISAGTTILVEPEASDPDGDDVSFRHVWRVNGDVVEDSGAELDTASLARGDVVVAEVFADDGSDEGAPLASPEIRVVNAPPQVSSRPGPATAGAGFRYRVEAVDPDGDAPLGFELEKAPSGMRIGANGEISWMPSRDQAGLHRVRVIVDDRNGGRSSHAFEIAVGAAGPSAEAVP